jgi:hypothetical protein
MVLRRTDHLSCRPSSSLTGCQRAALFVLRGLTPSFHFTHNFFRQKDNRDSVRCCKLELRVLSFMLTVREKEDIINTRIRREFQCFRSKRTEKPAFVSKIFAAVADFSQT